MDVNSENPHGHTADDVTVAPQVEKGDGPAARVSVRGSRRHLNWACFAAENPSCPVFPALLPSRPLGIGHFLPDGSLCFCAEARSC